MPRLQGRIDPDGAIINVLIAIGAADEEYLRATGQPVPEPFATTALIDPGASQTAVAPMIIDFLGAVPRGSALVVVPGQVNSDILLYDMQISLGSHRPFFEVQAVGVLPATHTVAVLIGRDMLKHAALFLDGENRRFSLWF